MQFGESSSLWAQGLTYDTLCQAGSRYLQLLQGPQPGTLNLNALASFSFYDLLCPAQGLSIHFGIAAMRQAATNVECRQYLKNVVVQL